MLKTIRKLMKNCGIKQEKKELKNAKKKDEKTNKN